MVPFLNKIDSADRILRITMTMVVCIVRIITLGYLVLTATCFPITGDEDLDIKSKADQPENIDELNKVLENVAYVNNFKNMMAGYVKEKYQNLTIIDMEKIKDILEEFCHQFAKDLKEVLQEESVVIKDNVDDGIPESTFRYIKESIQNEYPSIKENKADEVMLVLRRNLLNTREKIDKIIKDRSEIES